MWPEPVRAFGHLEAIKMSNLVQPHGGDGLNPLLIPSTERAEELERARDLVQVPMTSREVSDVLMMAMGAYTPIEVSARRVSIEKPDSTYNP